MENYQLKLDRLLSDLSAEGRRPRILMHACCAPCSSYVLEYLDQYADLTMFYYNPNMDTKAEYEKRADELRRLTAAMDLRGSVTVIESEYEHERFLLMSRGLEQEPERGARCLRCYEMRLRKTAEFFRERGGFDFFATTLTLSPLKNARAINETGRRVAEELGAAYLETDFKKKNGYLRSIELSKEYGLYRQNYCGCKFSKRGDNHE